jgi:type IV pilus assembly protein PilM
MARGAATRSVGLEIDTGMVRAVEAAGTAARPKLVAMARSPLPEGAVVEGMVLKPDEVGAALRTLWSSGRIKHRRVLLGVSNQGVLVRYATIPKVPKEKLEGIVRFYAQEHMPIPLESVVLGHQVIGETEADGKSMLEVLLVAARRDMLDGFLQALTFARLEPDDIDVSTLALMRILPPSALDRTVAVINVANGLSNILIASKGSPRLARLIAAKIKDLSVNLQLPVEQVIENGLAASSESDKAFEAWLNNLISEIRSSLNYYQNLENSSNVEAVIFNGSGALIGGVAPRLEAALEIPVRITNPFAGFTGSGSQKTGKGFHTVEYAICAGLARRGLEGS